MIEKHVFIYKNLTPIHKCGVTDIYHIVHTIYWNIIYIYIYVYGGTCGHMYVHACMYVCV